MAASRLSKSERLNHILNRMRVREDITPITLANELNVSERTIYRDLKRLEQDDTIKKRYSRREGRYIFEGELALPPFTLTPTETIALLRASGNPALGPGCLLNHELQAAIDKLAGPFQREDGAEPGSSNGFTSVSYASIHRPTFETIKAAILVNRKIRISYWTYTADADQRHTVSPFEIRTVDRRWRLLCRSGERSQLCTFAVDRIRAVEILEERFRFPRSYSADELFRRALQGSAAMDDDLEIEIRFSPAVASQLRAAHGREFTLLRIQPDGGVHCTVRAYSDHDVLWWILSYGTEAEVLGPPALRKRIAETAAQIASIYQRDPTFSNTPSP